MGIIMTPIELAELGTDRPVGARVLIRQAGRVLQAWDFVLSDDGDLPDGVDGVAATGTTVFGGPPAPDVGDDIATWFLRGQVEVITPEELAEMVLAKAADEAARPVLSLGAQGELVEAPVVVADGSTVVAASDDPARPRRSPAEVNRLIDAGMDRYAKRQEFLDAPEDDGVARQLAMRRRTLARFCRDYAQAWEDGEEPALLGMLENNLQVATRRVLELVDP